MSLVFICFFFDVIVNNSKDTLLKFNEIYHVFVEETAQRWVIKKSSINLEQNLQAKEILMVVIHILPNEKQY